MPAFAISYPSDEPALPVPLPPQRASAYGNARIFAPLAAKATPAPVGPPADEEQNPSLSILQWFLSAFGRPRRDCHFGKTEIARHRSTPFEGDRPAPRKLTENETLQELRRMARIDRRFLADNADRSASVQGELQMGLVSDAAFNLDEVPGRKPEWQWTAGCDFGSLGWSSARKGEGKKRLRKARENSRRFMKFASAAVAARTSFRVTRSGLNSPAIFSCY
jgi:hypothetical protein